MNPGHLCGLHRDSPALSKCTSLDHSLTSLYQSYQSLPQSYQSLPQSLPVFITVFTSLYHRLLLSSFPENCHFQAKKRREGPLTEESKSPPAGEVELNGTNSQLTSPFYCAAPGGELVPPAHSGDACGKQAGTLPARYLYLPRVQEKGHCSSLGASQTPERSPHRQQAQAFAQLVQNARFTHLLLRMARVC